MGVYGAQRIHVRPCSGPVNAMTGQSALEGWDVNEGIAKVVSVVTFLHELMGSNAFKQRLVFLTSGEQL